MNNRSLACLFALTLVGCHSQRDETLNLGGGGWGGAGGSSATGGVGGDLTSCPNPLLSYDPGDTPVGPLLPTSSSIGGITAGRMDFFSKTTTCQTVVVGIVIGVDVCELPDVIEIVTFDSLTLLPAMVPSPTAYTFFSLNADMLLPTSFPSVYELRLPLVTVHPAGFYPVVGSHVRPNLCPVLMPLCDVTRALEYVGMEWKADLPGQLYYGLADCSITGP